MKHRILPFVLVLTIFVNILASNRLDIYAATPTPTPTSVSTAISDAEIERDKQLTKELSLNIPDQTEDPNYPVTFVDPSKQGVEVSVDEKPATKVTSPYLLPNLAIGSHKLVFKFKNKDGIVRVLTKKILVTPKAPQFEATLKTEVVKPNSVTLKGTALPFSTILLVVNSTVTHRFTSNSDGNWEFIVPEPEVGENNIIAFAIKEGIVSGPSKTFSVQYKLGGTDNTATSIVSKEENAVLTFLRQLAYNINVNRVERPTIFWGAIGACVVVILLLIDLQLRRRAAKNRDEKTIANLFGTLQKEGGTIIDAIQSTKGSDSKKKARGAKPAALSSKKTSAQAVADSKPAVPSVLKEPSLSAETQTAPETKVKQKHAKKVAMAKTQTPAEPTESELKNVSEANEQETKSLDEVSIETEEPEKKILTKEEFLKQFQQGSEKDE